MAHGKRSQPEHNIPSHPPFPSEGAPMDHANHAGAAAQRFQAMVELSPDAILVLGPDGHIILVNREAERVFGRARADLLDHPIDLLVPLFPERFRSGSHPSESRTPTACAATATPSSSSSTIWTSSRPRTGSSTSAPRVASAVANWWRSGRRRRSSPAPLPIRDSS